MFAVNCIGSDALFLLVDGAPIGDIAREASFTVGSKITSAEVHSQRISQGIAHGQQLGPACLTITQTLAMATKPEFHQIGKTPTIGRLPLPFQPRFALVWIQHKALKRKRLSLGGKLLTDPRRTGISLAWSSLWVNFDKPLTR
ncbi:hypothetical protein PEKONANI_02947 [Aeromonas jandaei]